MYLQFIAPLLLMQVQAKQYCTTPNNEPGECIRLSSCTVLDEALQANPVTYVEEFVEKSICGGTKFIHMVCCGTSSNFTIPKPNVSKTNNNQSFTKKDFLPSTKYCGFQHSDDYFRTENDTSVRINEFPWLAKIMFDYDDPNDYMRRSLQCAGSLINTRYVLTAALCLSRAYKIKGVRLGDFNYNNETDCVEEPPFEQECSRFEDFDIDKIIVHPNYSMGRINTNNIALLKLNRSVIYTDYIRPICLPSPKTVHAKSGDILTTSGWGTDFYGTLKDHKKRILRKLITREECMEHVKSTSYSWFRKHLPNNNFCTVKQGIRSEQECNSDAGGPVMFSNRFQWHQEAIVSFSRRSCGITPEVHTNLTNYLEWIKENLEA